VLLRAFGPDTATAPTGVDFIAALALAERLGLTARIGVRARQAPEIQAASLENRQVVAALARASQVAAVSQLQARELVIEIAATARASGIPCCFLKGAALDAMGVLASGSRILGDVDVLVPERFAPALATALEARGFRAGATDEYPHQLPGLVHPLLGMVELHRHLPGMAKPGARGFATFDELAASGMLVPCDELGEGAAVPVRAALLAHLLAHGLAQHGFQPMAYPAMRLVGDGIDLGLAGEGGDELLDVALPWIEGSVPIEEALAVATLCRQLAAGDVPDHEGHAGLLLRHLLAGRLDARYAEALKLIQLAHPLTPASSLASHWATLKELLVLSRAQVDLIYGKPRSAWGYLGWRLLRPFDLLRRGARALYAAARH